MRKGLCILLFCVIVIGTTSSVVAITDHNLQWGIEVGDQFHYKSSGDQTFGFINFYIEINSLPNLLFDVVNFDDISLKRVHFSYCLENGTEMSSVAPWHAIAIGNWTLVQELLDSSTSSEYSWINTTTEWGISFTVSKMERIDPETEWVLVNTTTITKFSKTDGVLNLCSKVKVLDGGHTISGRITRIGFQSIPYLDIGIGVGIVAGIAVLAIIRLVYVKRR